MYISGIHINIERVECIFFVEKFWKITYLKLKNIPVAPDKDT